MWMMCAAALGGLLGTVARYGLNAAIQARAGTPFPLGIFLVNVLGCFATGFVAAYMAARGGRADVALFLTTGLCGGFTTMSAFSFDTVLLFQQGNARLAVLNVAATIVACLIAVWIGLQAGTAK
jgi:CrcB protein